MFDADDEEKKRVSQTSMDGIFLYQLSIHSLPVSCHPFVNTKIPHGDLSRTLPTSNFRNDPKRPQRRVQFQPDGTITTLIHGHRTKTASWWSHPPSRISPPTLRILFVHAYNPPAIHFPLSPDGRSERPKSYHHTSQNTRCQAAPLSPQSISVPPSAPRRARLLSPTACTPEPIRRNVIALNCFP